jgi:hypothetical protein
MRCSGQQGGLRKLLPKHPRVRGGLCATAPWSLALTAAVSRMRVGPDGGLRRGGANSGCHGAPRHYRCAQSGDDARGPRPRVATESQRCAPGWSSF